MIAPVRVISVLFDLLGGHRQPAAIFPALGFPAIADLARLGRIAVAIMATGNARLIRHHPVVVELAVNLRVLWRVVMMLLPECRLQQEHQTKDYEDQSDLTFIVLREDKETENANHERNDDADKDAHEPTHL